MPHDDHDTEVIAAMRLAGHRFNTKGMPADSLVEVAALEDILRSLVRQFWQERNPSRQRVPKGYDAEITLRLTYIDQGSAVPVLEHDPDLGIGDLFRGDEVRQDYARARDLLQQFIEHAQTGQGQIPPEIRKIPSSKMKKFGQSLRRDESIQIASMNLTDWGPITPYTPATRTSALSNLLGEYTERVTVDGTVTAITPITGKLTVRDRERKTSVQVPYLQAGVHVSIESAEQIFECHVEGIGEFTADGRLTKLDNISTLDIIDVTEDARVIRQLVGSLAALETGWIDGELGEPISPEVIDRSHAVIDAMIALGNITRTVFPTEEGGVRFYWPDAENQLSIEVEPHVALYIHTTDPSAGTFADESVPPDETNLIDRLDSWLAEEHNSD
ncbi:hypothetical protein [Nocardia sp. NPDC058480]|uniref:hypothetical protein n=1 Tax=unclassified Nocardia TaxID=2637762 RepID=UPI00364642F3